MAVVKKTQLSKKHSSKGLERGRCRRERSKTRCSKYVIPRRQMRKINCKTAEISSVLHIYELMYQQEEKDIDRAVAVLEKFEIRTSE